MSLPDVAIRRPITVLMSLLGISVFGFVAAGRLPVDLLPDLSYPTLTIQTQYPDAAPVSVEQYVSRAVEEAVGVIPGVREMRSSSRSGLSEVVLEFEWGEDMDLIALDVREKLGLVELPREAEPPKVLRYDPALDPIMRLALTGDRPLDDLRQLAERWVRPRLESAKGIAAARIRGGLVPEIVIEADEDRLAAMELTLDDIAIALQAENVNRPGGMLRDFNAVYLVRTLHEFVDLEQVRRTVVREDAAGRVRVEDVAKVYRGHRDRDEIVRVDGKDVVEIALHRAGVANTVAAAAAAREALEALRKELPPDLDIVVLSDQSRYISAAVREVWSSALLGGILAVLVLYFFLRDLRSTVLVGLTIPVSVVATFLPMMKAGVTLNIMSLGGLALGVGMLVDNSIVVLEAIDRRRREGKSRREAAAAGAKDVAGAVTAATLTTVAVFFPIVFVEGIAGQLFYDQAVTVCCSLLTSLLVSLTLIPALAAIEYAAGTGAVATTLFKWDTRETGDALLPMTFRLGPVVLLPIGNGAHWFSKVLTVVLFPVRMVALGIFLVFAGLWFAFKKAFALVAYPLDVAHRRLEALYPGLLERSLSRRGAVLGAALSLFVLSIVGLSFVGTNLVPDLAQGQFSFQLTLPEGTPLESTEQTVARIETQLADNARFQRIVSSIGTLPSAGSERRTVGENLAQIFFALPEGSSGGVERTAVERVRQVLSNYPHIEAEFVRPSVLTVQAPLAIRVYADELDVLEDAASQVAGILRDIDGVRDVAATTEEGSPEILVELDRGRAPTLGVTAELIGSAMRLKIRGDIIGQFREGEERFDIRLRSAASDRDQASKIENLRIRLPKGGVIPISAVADVTVDRGPAAIHRARGGRMAEISANVAATDLGRAMEEARAGLHALSLPEAATAEMAGQQQELKVSFESLMLAMALALFLVYGVMASQFESLLHPMVILVAAPLAAVGVSGALLLTGTPVSVLVLIGAVMLAGIVVNNAIVLVDAVNRRRREGQTCEAAIVGAGGERLRPILITTITTVLALLPMALGLGEGAELRAPLAITVVGGLTVATMLTLLVVPCLYALVSGDRRPEGGLEGEFSRDRHEERGGTPDQPYSGVVSPDLERGEVP